MPLVHGTQRGAVSALLIPNWLTFSLHSFFKIHDIFLQQNMLLIHLIIKKSLENNFFCTEGIFSLNQGLFPESQFYFLRPFIENRIIIKSPPKNVSEPNTIPRWLIKQRFYHKDVCLAPENQWFILGNWPLNNIKSRKFSYFPGFNIGLHLLKVKQTSKSSSHSSQRPDLLMGLT